MQVDIYLIYGHITFTGKAQIALFTSAIQAEKTLVAFILYRMKADLVENHITVLCRG